MTRTHLTSGKATHDPEPWFLGLLGAIDRSPYQETPNHLYSPRPEFDNHNPILVWLRACWDDPKCGTHAEIVDYMLNDPRMIDPRMHEFTPERIDHAKRVLTKLANVYGEA